MLAAAGAVDMSGKVRSILYRPCHGLARRYNGSSTMTGIVRSTLVRADVDADALPGLPDWLVDNLLSKAYRHVLSVLLVIAEGMMVTMMTLWMTMRQLEGARNLCHSRGFS